MSGKRESLLSEAARAVRAAEHPECLWPCATDEARMLCFKRAANVLGVVKKRQAKRRKKK